MAPISVIMPSLNVISYIDECLRSVLGQTMSDIEIICVDAGSVDGTLERLKFYADNDNRIKLVHSEIKSYGYQMNLGISIADGEYIAIVETDDVVEHDMFESLYRYAKKYNADYVKGQAKLFFDTDKGRMVGSVVLPAAGLKAGEEKELQIVDPGKFPKLFESDNFLWNGIYKKEFLQKIKFRETKGAAFQDISVLFRCISRAKKAIYIQKNVYWYRQDNIFASSYNSNSINYTCGEYKYIIDKCLKDLDADWAHICYVKLAKLLLDRFDFMTIDGQWWDSSLEGIGTIREILQGAVQAGEITEKDFALELWTRITGFIDSPVHQYEREQNLMNDKKSRLDLSLSSIGNKKIIIFGAGIRGQRLQLMLNFYGENTDVEYTDNNQKLWDKEIGNIKVVNPGNIKMNENSLIIIAVKKNRENIIKQLRNMEIEEKYIYSDRGDDLFDFRLLRYIFKKYKKNSVEGKLHG